VTNSNRRGSFPDPRIRSCPDLDRPAGKPGLPCHNRSTMTTPRFVPPMLATLVAAPFDDPGWLFEV
jgi:hypothetical protein